MTSLIRKYASPLALLAVLAALVAAPYLIPENPDSEVFRTGTLGTLLLFVCYMPLKRTYSNLNRRTFVCAAAFGFLFSAALSLGAELRFYGGLLSGMGSMLRRLAVPVMSTPLLGGLAACLMHARTHDSGHDSGKEARFPFLFYMGVILLCWLPLLIAFYPGMFNYDLNTEYRQFYYGEWDYRHPLLYIVLCYGVYHLGRIIGQPEFALFLVTVLRMLSFAAALAYSCVFLQRRRAPRWALLLLTGAYALLPVFSVMAVSSAKDTPFTAAVIALTLMSIEMMEDPVSFFKNRRRCALYLLMIVLAWHLRKNGVAVMVLLPLTIALVRGRRRQAAVLCAVGVAASLLLGSGLQAIFKPFDQPAFQLYSLPAQQLARVYQSGSLSEEDKAEIHSWYVDEYGLTVYPHLADAAKGYLDQERLKEHSGDFLRLWARLGKGHPKPYAEAFLLLNIGSWYPDDLSHSEIYNYESWNPKGYLQTNEYDFSEYGVRSFNPLPAVRNFYNRLCRFNTYQKYPVISVLLCTATPVWILAFACAQLIARRKARYLLGVSGLAVLWISYLLGPCTLARYMLPMFCLAPVMLILSFCLPQAE